MTIADAWDVNDTVLGVTTCIYTKGGYKLKLYVSLILRLFPFALHCIRSGLLTMNKTLVKSNTLWALTLRGFANNKGTDQPAHSRRLISAFVIRFFGKFVILTCYKRNFNFHASLCSWGDWFDSCFVGNTFSETRENLSGGGGGGGRVANNIRTVFFFFF